MAREIRKRRYRGSSRALNCILPRLALRAGVGVCVFAMALSCGDDEYTGGPKGDPNPDDHHPVWVFEIHRWAKYDQNGHKLLEKYDRDLGRALGLNPANGDIWAAGSGGIEIYNSYASLKKNTKLEGHVQYIAFDTKDKKVWILHEPEIYHFWLAKLTYEGDVIFNEPFGREDPRIQDMDVYEEAGAVWITSTGGSQGGYIYKLDKRGDIILFKTGRELGYEYCFDDVRVDQTDGSVWIEGRRSGGGAAPFILKIDQAGKPVQKLYSADISLSDVGRATGDVLIGTSAGDLYHMRLYDRSGGVLWRSEDTRTYGYGRISDYDGGSWCYRWWGPEGYKMSKISRTGEYLIRDIPIPGSQDFIRLFIKNDPYPH